MYVKIEISGILEVATGLHIGGNSAFAAIGAVDSPVIKDVRSSDPMIPGSSLKGKMRTLLAKKYNETFASKPDEDAECISNLFGTARNGRPKAGRLLFSDMYLNKENKEELRDMNIIHPLEVKFENSISRTTAVATPRQIERVIRGTQFDMNLIYEVDDNSNVEKDFRIICDGLKLLKYDYLGGSGSRGYGKVDFRNLDAEVVVGEVEQSIIDHCNDLLAEV